MVAGVEIKDIFTHTLPATPQAQGVATVFQLGYASLTPTPPTDSNAPLASLPGFASLLALDTTSMSNPQTSKAIVEYVGSRPIVLGVLDQASTWPVLLLPGETLMWPTASKAVGTYIHMDSVGAIHISTKKTSLVISPTGDIAIQTGTHQTTLNTLLDTVNQLIAAVNQTLTVSKTLANSSGTCVPTVPWESVSVPGVLS